MERIPKKKKHVFRVQLGDDIVFEILTWLPSKSLMRFKCVCKAWNILIRYNPSFVKAHIARSHARGPSAIHLLFQLDILSCEDLEFFKSDYVPKTRPLEGFSLQLAPHYSDTRDEIVICSNHCNGLVCLFYKDKSQVYLYNVTTGEMKPLPSSLVSCSHHVPKLFLGFDMVTGKYKLLHAFYCLAQLKAEILTLGTNSRREIELIHEKFTPWYFARDCLFLNGILYWRSTSFDSSIDYFDFIEEKFDDVPPPEGRNFIHNPEATFWGKLVWYWSYFGNKYKTPYSLISSDEVNKVRMKVNSESVKLVFA